MPLKITANALPAVASVHRVARHVMARLVAFCARQHVKRRRAFVLVPLHRGVLALVAMFRLHDVCPGIGRPSWRIRSRTRCTVFTARLYSSISPTTSQSTQGSENNRPCPQPLSVRTYGCAGSWSRHNPSVEVAASRLDSSFASLIPRPEFQRSLVLLSIGKQYRSRY